MKSIKYTKHYKIEYVFTCWTDQELQQVREYLKLNRLIESEVLHRDECDILIAHSHVMVQECEFGPDFLIKN
jgi:hypothetical protein